MKKLTIFLVIALLANVSSATRMDILVDGELWTGGDVAPSDIITVQWINDEAYQYGGFGNLIIAVSNGDYMQGSGYINPALALGSITVTPTDPGHSVLLTGSAMPTPEGIMASWEFHVPDYKVDSDIIVIDPIQGAWLSRYAAVGPDDPLPYVELHVTPEPTTIALLGIGALSLLRRRRKA